MSKTAFRNRQRSSIRTNYFSDGQTLTDFVLVVPAKVKTRFTHHKFIKTYIQALQENGMKIEIVKSRLDKDYFVRISLTSSALKHFAKVYNIDIKYPGHYFLPIRGLTCKEFETPLTEGQNDLFKRKRGATSMERILIIDKILNDIEFGAGEHNRGLKRLLQLGVVKEAFPLHDGDYHYTNEQQDTEMNDRQLLLKYWGNFSLWYKKQPLNLVEKYYGPEVAFYFAWLGFYNLMLIPASIVGVICFFGSVVQLLCWPGEIVSETCESEILICERCYSGSDCTTRRLKDTCQYAQLTYLFDNGSTVFFAVFMSLWAALFLSLWRRVENILKVRWNVEYVELNNRVRSDYIMKATALHKSSITGDLVAVIPWKKRILYESITSFIFIIILGVIILTVLGIMLFGITLSETLRERNVLVFDSIIIIVMMTTAVLQVIFIKLFGQFYAPLSIFLTKMETPRTQAEFDRSVIFKRFLLGFVNNYVPLFYIAFIKGHLYSPKDIAEGYATILSGDVCHPQGCIVSLCIQLSFYMFLKSMVGNIITLIKPKVLKLCQCWRKIKKKQMYQCEIEYELESSDDYQLTSEFMEMIIQYGFVTFFVAAFPLAPLCALINNTMELRLDAYKFITRYRRPIPKRQDGIGSWNDVLKTITYLSTATNAFVLAFTSDFVPRQIYKTYNHLNSTGYVNASLSAFKVYDETTADYVYCHYRGKRYHPDHKNKYDFTPEYFYELGIKFLVVIAFEHLVVLFRGALLHNVPDVPRVVKEKHYHEMNIERDLKIKLFEKKWKKREVRKRTSIIIQKKGTKNVKS